MFHILVHDCLKCVHLLLIDARVSVGNDPRAVSPMLVARIQEVSLGADLIAISVSRGSLLENVAATALLNLVLELIELVLQQHLLSRCGAHGVAQVGCEAAGVNVRSVGIPVLVQAVVHNLLLLGVCEGIIAASSRCHLLLDANVGHDAVGLAVTCGPVGRDDWIVVRIGGQVETQLDGPVFSLIRR